MLTVTDPKQTQAVLRDWERRVCLVALGPLLWLQGRYVKRATPRLPEPDGPRQGTTGRGPLLRLLIAGDSAAVGVGAPNQSQALSGQLVAHLSRHWTVQWTLEAVNGLDTPGLIALLQGLPARRFDVVVLSNGANDVTALRTPAQWLPLQTRLATLIEARFDPGLLVHCALPPMHAFTALPQPLRWFIGRWANEMNRRLALSLTPGQPLRQMHRPFPGDGLVSEGLASDGFHPGPKAYAVWAQSLADFIVGTQAQWAVKSPSPKP